MTQEHVLPLDTEDAGLEVVGGKGKSLARMATAGLAVPGGFHLAISAYRSFVEENNLQAAIIDLAKPEIVGSTVSFETASARIQELFKGTALSDALAAEIRQAYIALDGEDPAVAVRSSANAEDLPDMSFAGQQDTYLNVRGGDALLAAVQDCWASLWTPRAISYRHQMGIEQDAVAMAVVVQTMVPSDVSGILFTANPATGERSEIIINASFGLGEAVVGGQVTPDTYVVDRQSLAAKETMIGAKEQKIVSDGDHGTRLEDIAESERGQSSLSEEAIKEMASVALTVEKHFDGVPQDIEWAIKDGKLWLLQSRPITKLPPQPIEVVWEPPPGVASLVRRQVVENIPDPLCTLFEELYLTDGLHYIDPEALKAKGASEEQVKKFIADRTKAKGLSWMTANGYAYLRAGTSKEGTAAEWREALKSAKVKAAKSPEGMAMAKQDMEKFIAELSDEEAAAFREMADKLDSDDLANDLTMPESDNPTFIAFNRTAINDNQLKGWYEDAMPGLVAKADKWRKVDPGTASDEHLLTGMRELACAEGYYWTGNTSHTFGVAKSTDDQLQQFLAENLPDHNFTSGQFLSGFKSKTMQANEDMWGISKLIQADDALYELVLVTPAARLMGALQDHPASGPVLAAIDAYLEIYGHQSCSLDFVEPTPIEDPSMLFVTLKTMVADRAYDPMKHEVEATRRREKALHEVSQLLDGLKYWQFRYRLWFSRKYYPIREESMYYLGISWPVLRPMALELGRRLVEAGTLPAADDVFYLNTAELTTAADARKENRALPEYGPIAAERRELREARKRLHPPGTIPPEASENPALKFKQTQILNDPNSDTLRGIPVSPGTVTAPVSLINSPAEFDQMKPGSILVCSMTNPAWTPLFAHASGLVTDMGGILGHGSIVAREYGIPAVVGTGNITQRAKSGRKISVDGDAGIVELLEEE